MEDLRRFVEELLGESPGNKIIQFPGGDFHIAGLLRQRVERLCLKKCTFVEVFGGSGYMAQTVSREKFSNIVYNDVNNMLVTLYRHVKENPELLAAVLSLLPYARSYYEIVTELVDQCKDFGSLVAAALIFYAYNSSFYGKVAKGFAYMAAPDKNAARAFRSRTLAILKYAERWRDVIIENLDFRDVIKRYDSADTVFYLDPPYPDRSVEYYGVKFTLDDLRDMATLLTRIRGKFLLKLDYKSYEQISDILTRDKYVVEVIEHKRHMKKLKGTQRDAWLLTLVSSPQ